MDVPKIASAPRLCAAPRYGRSTWGMRSVGCMASSSKGIANVFTAVRMNLPRLTVSWSPPAATPVIGNGRNGRESKTAESVRRDRDRVPYDDMKKNGKKRNATRHGKEPDHC